MKLPKIKLSATQKLITIGLAGVLFGALIILGIRVVTYKPDRVHYHANFSLYINGTRERFVSHAYYEEEGSSCTLDKSITPINRAHMHDLENDIIHVHDSAVSWGNFFENLGWTVTDRLVESPDNVYLADKHHKVRFILNGQPVTNITNKVIGDQDRLLVDYGKGSSKELVKEFNGVATTAKQEDEGSDPASCAGSAPTTIGDRMRHMF